MAELEAGEYKLFSLELNDRDPVFSNPRGQQFGYPPDYFPGAADFGTDLVVMGGYGHSRWRELVLGGATRSMLKAMTVPVLMSH